MVRLTVTQSMLAAMKYCSKHRVDAWPPEQLEGEPSLQEPSLGQPITHAQVIALSACLKDHFQSSSDPEGASEPKGIVYDLDRLLRGSRVYIEPPRPKKEPTPEFQALMSRLREEEEARAYERMMNPLPPPETFSQHFPGSSVAQVFPAATAIKEEEDEITYAEINRQIALIINVLVSIVACSVAIWMAARHWSTPSRLGLSMGGSGVVGLAEVVVYAGYLRRVKEAKAREKKKPEIKEVIGTWVISSGQEKSAGAETKLVTTDSEPSPLRRRLPNKGSVP